MSDIAINILETVTYFDLFDFPLSSDEVFRYLGVKSFLPEVEQALDDLVKAQKLEARGGLFLLSGREKILETREMRENYFERKIKKAKLVSGLFRLIPWIKMIAVGNLMGDKNLRDESDIDFFIVTDAKRIWISRLLTVALIKILGMRPKIHDLRDKICLSFFVSTEALDLRPLRLDDEDIYFDYWLANLFVIVDRGGIYEKLRGANVWMGERLPNISDIRCQISDIGKPVSPTSRISILGWLEDRLRKLQIKIMPIELKSMMNKDTKVVVNSRIIKMHSNDRREKYRKLWQERISGL